VARDIRLATTMPTAGLAFNDRRRGAAALSSRRSGPAADVVALAVRVRGEYEEMPGLRLTVPQAARLFGITTEVARIVLEDLRRASVLKCSARGNYSLADLPSGQRGSTASHGDHRSLSDASADRLACLLRHWTWAAEARAQFERELAQGWDYDEDPIDDHPFGAYYHWCALLCGLCEAAVESGLASMPPHDPMSRDLAVTLPQLRACRQLLVTIPDSMEEQPRVVDLLRDEATLGRLRRVHDALGEALRAERLLREIDSLDH